jgi:hypothetical protein
MLVGWVAGLTLTGLVHQWLHVEWSRCKVAPDQGEQDDE